MTPTGQTELEARAGAMLMEVLRRTHLSPPDALSTVVAEEARRIGVAALVLYLRSLPAGAPPR